MKTIRFKTQDQTEWIINTNQITCLSPNKNGVGTYVYLSCGRNLHTQLSVSTLLGMIERCGKEDLED